MTSVDDRLIEQLKALFGELAGDDLETADTTSSFMELGFDSLLLTQVSASVKKRYKVKVSFRQLLEECDCFESLAKHILPMLTDAQVAELKGSDLELVEKNDEMSFSQSQPAAEAPPPVRSTKATQSSSLQDVVNEQLRIMEMQIELLHGRSTSGIHSTSAARATNTADKPSPLSQALPSIQAAKPAKQHGPYKPLDIGSGTGLTQQQHAHLDWFIPRYVDKTPKSKQYAQTHRKRYADPRVVAGFKPYWKEMVYPIVSTKSKGSKLWDLDGNEWVDVTMGFGVAMLGHSPDFINAAVSEQLMQGVEIGPQSPIAGEVAELICEFTGLDRVTFCNTGSEAVMAALRICRTVTGRSKVALFAGAYHGTFDEVLVKGSTVKGQLKTLPLAPGVMRGHIQEVTVLDYGTTASLDWIRDNAEDLAAVLVETVQSRHPGLQPTEFLREVRAITTKAETPLIFDEVITGFRCHPGGAQAYFGIEADLATYGKVIGGGMPFGFIAGKAELMDAFDGGYWEFGDDSIPTAGVTFYAGTFVRHPLAMAAARAMLLHLKEHGETLQRDLAEKTKSLIDGLNTYFRKHAIPFELERFTSVWYPHFEDNVPNPSLLYYHLREKGLHIWEGRPCFLSTAHTEEDVQFIANSFKQSIAEMQSGGFMPGTSDPEFQLSIRESGTSTNLVSHPSSDDRFPLAVGQREMWLGSQIAPEAAGPHHTCNAMRLVGELDPKLLKQAIGKVIERHEALRSTFSEDGREIICHPDSNFDFPIIDFSELPETEAQARFEALFDKEAHKLFDLTKGPLIAFTLVKLSPRLHYLVLAAQMIVCDGWSHYVVFEELSSIYSSLKRGDGSELPKPNQMREYAYWLESSASQEDARECEAYWKSVYETTPEPLDLPTCKPRRNIRSFEADRRTLALEQNFYNQIKRFAKSRKISTFALFLTAYQVWLSKLSSQTDVVVGVPFSEQGTLGMDSLIGQCANTLPIRCRISDENAFSETLSQTWESLLDSQEHSNFTFGSLIEHLEIPNDASRIPLVSALFNLDPPMSRVAFEGLEHRFVSGPRIYYQYDIGFNLVEEEDRLRVECDFRTELFEGDTISSWLNGYKAILETVINETDPSISRINLIPKNAVVVTPKLPEPLARNSDCVLDLVTEQIARVPDSTAVKFEETQLTYQQLEERSNQIAHALIKRGVKKGDLIGFCLERSTDIVAALLAIMKTGAAYVPIDDRFPLERKEYLLRDSGAHLVLTRLSQISSLKQTDCDIFCLEREAESIAQQPKTRVNNSLSGNDLAYVIYTSGSTGEPKGVEIEHSAAANFLRSMTQEPGISADDSFLALTSLSFDISLLELIGPLIVGGKTCIVSRDTALDPRLFTQAIKQHQITIAQATPTSWKLFVENGWKGNPELKLLCGGEDISESLANALLKRCAELWNMYGPTETTVWSSCCKINSPNDRPIGNPILGTHFFVLNESLQPSPFGVPGQLYIGGVGLARGYRRKPELTSSKFIASPINTNGRAYATGDKVVRKPNGNIYYIGRYDHQVKVRGCLVELSEIEEVLSAHPGISEAVVIQRSDLNTGTGLVAYLVREKLHEQGKKETELIQELRDTIKLRLPEYMRLDYFVVLDRIPQNPIGKLDRSNLPLPDSNASLISDSRVLPTNQTQKHLTRIWENVLKSENISITDNYFDLGGQSLLAVKIFNEIETTFGKKLPLASLFRAPTIRELATVIDGGTSISENWKSLVKIKAGNDEIPLFLIHGAGGNVLLYQALAAHLPEDLPLYGLQSRGLDGETAPLKTIESMAEAYLEEIREVQPKGPYYLGGYCLGGTVAYEIAQRLIDEGENVGLVAMLDTYNFCKALKSSSMSFILQKLKFHLANFIKLQPREMKAYLAEKIRLAKDGEFTNLFSSRPGATAESGVARASSGSEATVQALNDDAAEAYQPNPLSTRLTLFKPQLNYKFYPDPNMGWGDLADELHIVELPVNPHAMLVEPYVEQLGQDLTMCIESCTKQPSPPKMNLSFVNP